tara:strand:+ start:593 stop:1327 length:735 start_codon:yes stop_codon:yes gene_type:complete
MLSKQTIKFITSLRYNKYRLKYNCFVAEGTHTVEAFMNSGFKFHSVFCTSNWHAMKNIKNINIITNKELRKISSFKNPSNVLAIIYKPDYSFNMQQLLGQNKIILLDSISDPGNMGSIIRTADWFGVSSIYLSKKCVDVFNSKVVQSAMGSIARVEIYIVSLEDVMKQLKKANITCYGACLSGSDLYSLKKTPTSAIVFGSESHGISNSVEELLDQKILIPTKNKLIDSLNVSVAFGIILSEFR